MVIVTNWANVSNAKAPPTSVEVPLSLMSSHSTIDRTPAAPAAAAENKAYSPRGHGALRAPATRRNSAALTRTRIGERANHWTSGPLNVAWAISIIPHPPGGCARSSPRLLRLRHRRRDLHAGPGLDVLEEAVDARPDAVEQRLGVDAD